MRVFTVTVTINMSCKKARKGKMSVTMINFYKCDLGKTSLQLIYKSFVSRCKKLAAINYVFLLKNYEVL